MLAYMIALYFRSGEVTHSRHAYQYDDKCKSHTIKQDTPLDNLKSVRLVQKLVIFSAGWREHRRFCILIFLL